MSKMATVADVRSSLIERREIALIDVREEATFAESHPLFAASLPFGQLELEVLDRIPRLTAPIVVYDGGEGWAQKAQVRLRELGYTDVSVLEGGLRAWDSAGAELFRDVNVPSKAFGELVEATRHTPSIEPHELRRKLDSAENVVVLDARRLEEYHVMSIPSAISVPGAELVLRVRDLVPDPKTLVVVNCAGRTRSIIGAQSLINAAIPNPVAALRNGTIGWSLAGLALEHAQVRSHDTSLRGEAPSAARTLAKRAGVGSVDWDTMSAWVRASARTVYRFDVRTPQEYGARHPAGFRSAPGGQLVQETDVFAPVRGARIVLTDDDGVRANMTASWLAQMGWEVFVLATWPHEDNSEYGPGIVHRPLLPQVGRYKRPYEGTDNPRAAMQAYLDWEYGLVDQLRRDGTHHFRVL
jgi:rhodanese-related sulfurtransferase